MSKHTPTPWVADFEYTDEGRKARVFRNAAFQYALTAYGTMSDEDASYIVRAVNAHEGLVRALDNLLAAAYMSAIKGECFDEDAPAIVAARAALSAAKE